MAEELLQLTVDKLFQKFGAGNHKPGSGSAAAMQGMLSAQFIRTVISLTIGHEKHFEEWIPELKRIDSEIESRIYPSLEQLFQKDSDLFDKVIKLRIERDNEKNPKRRDELTTQALQELKPATETPIEIAKLCIELAGFAKYVFDHGFKAAGGDSSLSLNSAVSAIAGCLSIIDLNLFSFVSDDWTNHIREEEDQIRSSYTTLISDSGKVLDMLKKKADRKNAFHLAIQSFLSRTKDVSNWTYSEIEETVVQLQNAIWEYREFIWKKNTPEDPIQTFQPDIVFEQLGYRYEQLETLGLDDVQGELVKVAGIIDKENKTVNICDAFSLESQRFTAAHELGHVILHEQSGLHRDRTLDGSSIPGTRPREELQADKFATFFLMPRKDVKEVFELLFSMKKFVINEDTMFAINQRSVTAFRAKCKNLRGLAQFLAEYKTTDNNSLSEIFSVSVKTMAIRLEELELVEF